MFFNAPHLISSEEICLIGLRKVAEVHVWLTSVWGIASSCIFDNFISHLASLLKAKYVKKVWNQSNRCMAIMLHAFLANISFFLTTAKGNIMNGCLFVCQFKIFQLLSKVLRWMQQGCKCNSCTLAWQPLRIRHKFLLKDVFVTYLHFIETLWSLKQKLICDRCQKLLKIRYPDYG